MNFIELYIKVVNNVCEDHPILPQTLRDAFPDVDVNDFNLIGYQKFLRIPLEIPAGQKHVETKYEFIDGVWRDVHYFEPIGSPPQEVIDEQNERYRRDLTNYWKNRDIAYNYETWTYDENLKQFVAPIPRPNDGNFYRWYGKENRWRLAEPFPQDGKKYKFDFESWTNVEVLDEES